jgi:pilus assembly protein Flp/PilA
MDVRHWLRLRRDCTGATAIEYGLIAALIAAVIFGTMSSLRELVRTLYATVAGIAF